jgi:hypothetical protein
MLIKKTLNFKCLATERDLVGDNYLLIRAELQNQTVILGTIYGPNKKDDDFFRRLSISLNVLGRYPIVLGGDWNAVFSCLPTGDNPDIFHMQDVPNANHSKKIRELRVDYELSDPFRVLFPNRSDFSYVPYGTMRKNRSRLDFFLVSVDVMQNVDNCYIKENTQSKLFDHKAIVLDFNKIKPASSRPNITNSILHDPDLDTIVKLSYLECYSQLCEDDNIKLRALERIKLCFKKMREAGPDPYYVEYSHAELLDIDIRNALKDELRWLLDKLDKLNLPETANSMEDDDFLEYLINNIRNEVIQWAAM